MRKRYLLLGGFAAAIVLVDQISKAWALDRLEDGSSIRLVGSLQLKLTFNTGTAFSFGGGSGLGPWIAVLVLIVVGAVIWYGRMVRSNTLAVALGLILGGAVGNLIDRAARGETGFMSGAVTDFIDLQWWPVFNIADAAIVVGAIMLIASLVFGSGDAASSAPSGHDDGSSNSEGSP